MQRRNFISVGFLSLITLFTLYVAGCSEQRAILHKTGEIYEIKVRNLVMEIDPKIGGRITSLRLDGQDFLTGKDINPDNWGSTLWPSPQKEWGAAPHELDNMPYSVSLEGNIIKMRSLKDAKFGFVFVKEISGDVKNNSFKMKYTLINQSVEARKVAPWEVTRVHTKGITFFPTGPGGKWGKMANLAEDKEGITWFAYEGDKIPVDHNKFFADGAEGWIAHVNGDVLFVKKFPDIPAHLAAPTESDVSIYTNPERSYVEIEAQGFYQELKPSDSLTWEVNWILRKIPANVTIEDGSPSLISYVRNEVNKL